MVAAPHEGEPSVGRVRIEPEAGAVESLNPIRLRLAVDVAVTALTRTGGAEVDDLGACIFESSDVPIRHCLRKVLTDFKRERDIEWVSQVGGRKPGEVHALKPRFVGKPIVVVDPVCV